MSLKRLVRGILSRRTLRGLRFDLARLKARMRNHRRIVQPRETRLHVGCGRRHVQGWLNVDVGGSPFNVDLACGSLPWPSGSFEAIVAQQVIEHLELDTALMPLLRELLRVARPGCEIWLSTPDLACVCQGYCQDLGAALVTDRKTRWENFTLEGKPVQNVVNVLFHQNGEHVNLFDYDLLKWVMLETGWVNCVRVDEDLFLARFPEFPRRGDQKFSLYLKANAPG